MSVWRWMRSPFGLYVLGMLVIGNAKALVLPRTFAGSWAGVAVGLIVVLISLLSARLLGLHWRDLGLANWREAAPRSILIGLATVLGLTIVLAVVAHIAGAAGRPLQVPPPPGDLGTLSDDQLRQRVLVFLPFDTAIPEEVAFRGVIYGELWLRTRSTLWAIFWSSVCFTAWHGALGISELLPDFGFLQLALKLGGYFIGGPVFSVPRRWGYQLAGCSVAHWLTDTLLMVISHPSGAWLRSLVFGV